MGVLGIIVGVSLILPFLQGLVLLNTFWLFALGAAVPRPLAQRDAARVGERGGRAMADGLPDARRGRRGALVRRDGHRARVRRRAR